MVVQDVLQIRPLFRDEYDKLIQLGAFEDERIELWEGALVERSPIGPPHSTSVQSFAPGESITPLAFPDVVLSVSSVI